MADSTKYGKSAVEFWRGGNLRIFEPTVALLQDFGSRFSSIGDGRFTSIGDPIDRGGMLPLMKRKSSDSYSTHRGATTPAYRMPAYGTPLSEPPSPMREPPSAAKSLHMPGIDERLARPEEGEEYVDGERIGWQAMAGEPAHADPQCRLAYVVSACVGDGYIAATELLTRADKDSDFATDVCVRRGGIDPPTNERYPEELSFEVANAQTLARLEKRAKKLVARGVRRVFGILVREGRVLEWARTSGFKDRPMHGQISDRTFKKPLRVRAILDAAAADRLVAEALWEKREPYLVQLVKKGRKQGHEEGREQGREQGREATLRSNIRDLCAVLAISWPVEREVAVSTMSLPALETLWEHLVKHKAWHEEEAAEPL